MIVHHDSDQLWAHIRELLRKHRDGTLEKKELRQFSELLSAMEKAARVELIIAQAQSISVSMMQKLESDNADDRASLPESRPPLAASYRADA